MKLKRNVIPLGSGVVFSARVTDKAAEFFMSSEGVIVKKIFDFDAHSLTVAKGSVAYADGYLALAKGAAMDLGEIVYARYN